MHTTVSKYSDLFLTACFRLHDLASSLIAKNFLLIKRSLLVFAFLNLFWIFFPEVRRGVGNMAEMTLLFILFLSPLSKIFRIRLFSQLMGLRREFGILMGCLAIAHGISYFIDPLSFSLSIAPYLDADFLSMPPLFYFGILGLLLTLPLLLTSNNLSMRLLGGKKWKMLHRIVYVLLLAVLLHVFFVQSARRGYAVVDMLQPAGIIFGYILLKLLAWKNFLSPLQRAIAYVSERYKNYVIRKGLDVAPVLSS